MEVEFQKQVKLSRPPFPFVSASHQLSAFVRYFSTIFHESPLTQWSERKLLVALWLNGCNDRNYVKFSKYKARPEVDVLHHLRREKF